MSEDNQRNIMKCYEPHNMIAKPVFTNVQYEFLKSGGFITKPGLSIFNSVRN